MTAAYALIVTYGDRYELCSKVIDGCLEQGICKVIVVDNGSTAQSSQKLLEKAKNYKNITVVKNGENLGSAGGYKAGLKYILDEKIAEYVWMLDDDTVPSNGAYQAIRCASSLFKISNEERHVLYSYRGNHWVQDFIAVHDGILKKYLKNNFCGFNLFNKILELLAKKIKDKKINYPIIRTTFGPYGGMFIPTSLISIIGYPNEQFFSYADDHDFSLRINELNINQYLIYSSQLIDIDNSFSKNNSYFNVNVNEIKLFYTIRNHVYLSQQFIKNRYIYNLNKNIFQLIILKEALKGLINIVGLDLIWRRLKIIHHAISQGEAGHLGVIDKNYFQ